MIILSILFFVTAIFYSSVGFGGGSTYLAILLITGVPYYVFPALALICNIFVVSGNSYNYIRAGNLNLKLLSLYNNEISEIDVLLNTNLETLILYSNPINKIELNENKDLRLLNLGNTLIDQIDLSYNINLISTIKILEIIRNTNKKILFIYSSSDKAYGELKSGSYYESHPLSSIYPYDVSKSTSDLIAQSYSKTYKLKVGIIRSANIFGPNDKNLKRIVPETIINLLNKRKIVIRSNGKLKRDYIYVDDVADAYLLTFKKLLKSKNNLLIYNVGSKYNLSVLEIVKKIAI